MPLPSPPSIKDLFKSSTEFVSHFGGNSSEDKLKIITEMLEFVANFVDKHDIIVPDLHVKIGIADISLSAKKLEDSDASKKASEEVKTDPEIKKPE